MKVYLASPLFTEFEREKVKDWASMLRGAGEEVYVPMEHSIPNAWDMDNAEWGSRVFKEDVKAIDDCDMMIVLYYGLYSDSGTAWEQGYAYAKGKFVQVINVNKAVEVSLMVVNGQRGARSDEFEDSYQT